MAVPLKEYKLDQIVTFEKSYSFSRACEGEGIFKHIHYGDIHTKLPYIVDDAEKLPNITETGNFITLNYGDILVADASEDTKDLGKAVCYLDSKNTNVIAGLHTISIRVNKEIAVPEYLINLFQTKRYRKFVWKMGTGVSVLGLSKTNLATYPIFLPSIDEQREVANNFMKLNKKIQLQQEKIDLLKEQKKGFMQKIFSQELRFKDGDGAEFPEWGNKLIGEIAEVIMGQSPDGSSYSEDSSDTILVQGNADLKNGKIVPRIYTSQITKMATIGDIILTVRAPVGIVAKCNIPACIGRGVCAIRSDEFLFYYLDYYYITSQWIKLSQGSTFDSVNSSDIKNIIVPQPCTKEKEIIVSLFDRLTHKINLEEEILSELEKQKQAFMQQMFI